MPRVLLPGARAFESGMTAAAKRTEADTAADAAAEAEASYRETRALPPFITRSTSASVAALVSPGVVIASAP